MGRKTIYPINCACCDPPFVLADSNSKQNHKKKMPKKRNLSEDEAAIPALLVPSGKKPKIAVKDFYFYYYLTKYFLFCSLLFAGRSCQLYDEIIDER
jgi:hypothetical protein